MSTIVVKTIIKFKRGLASEWTDVNPILQAGEPGFETDTNKVKIGNGVSTWNTLPYLAGGGSGSEVSADEKSISIKYVGGTKTFYVKGFDDAAAGQIPRKASDGTFEWVDITSTITQKVDERVAATTYTKSQMDTKLSLKQGKLTAGSNITIVDDVISATGGGGGSSVLTQAITAGYTVGGISQGKNYPVGTTIEQVLRDLLVKPVNTRLYYSVGKTVPTSVTGMTPVSTTKETLLQSGYLWKNINLDEDYAFLAIDKTLEVSCYEIKQNGFALGFETVDLGDQILYYPSEPGTDTGVRLQYSFE